MRRGTIGIALAITFVLLSFKTATQELEWKTWNEGFKKSKELNKIALIDTYTDWCGWCKKMDRDTYADEGIVKKINDNFIPIKFNPEKAGTYEVGDTTFSGPGLLRALNQGKSSGYPTTFFYMPRQNKMFQYPGYMNADQFGKLLDKLVEYHNQEAETNQ